MKPLTIAVCWLQLLAAAALAEETAFYVHENRLVGRSLADGGLRDVGALEDRVQRLAVAPNGELIAIAARDDRMVLQTIDLRDASQRDVADLSDEPLRVRGFAIDDQGIHWFTLAGPPVSGSLTHLLRYDPQTGEESLVALSEAVGLLAYRDGVLYGTRLGQTLSTIDPQTGVVTDLFTGGAILIAAFGADFSSDGLLWLAKQGSVDIFPEPGRLDGIDLENQEVRASFELPETVSGLAIADVGSCDGLCLRDGRFRVTGTWRNFEGQTGDAKVVGESSGESGLLYFFHADNWEVIVKVIDGCTFNEHFWVFAASATNVEFTLEVTDLQTGLQRRYGNELGNTAPAITDVSAFATCP